MDASASQSQSRDGSRTLPVVELLLTADAYESDRELDERDLRPRFRQALWDDDGVSRPTPVTEAVAREATGVEEPWDAVSGLMFTERDSFSGAIELVDADLAADWFLDRVEEERFADNPALIRALGDRSPFEVEYEAAREANPSVRSDRAWIDALLAEFDEEDEEMLDLVEVRAPEEVRLTLDDLVLTEDQTEEVRKVMKAIENREYLARIGLHEIGKLLFVGPPGTGKTSTARGLARELDMPIVEVQLSMVTSQYLGETAKNVDKVFEVAKRLSPCILFIDEFDFVAKTRRSDEHAAIKRAVNTLLKSIDEISLVEDDVLLIGATNHPDQLDTAAWRRFDEILDFPRPDEAMRADIIRVITREMAFEDFDAEGLAARTEGLTGSDLRLVLREAVLAALLEDRRELTQEDLLDAVDAFDRRDELKGDRDGHDHDDHDH
jgi:SpoVK/Ycf46/Vps4 family AAA+-type ATPase